MSKAKVIYVAGAFRSRNNPYGYNYYAQHLNIVEAETVALQVWQAGHVALCPHLNTINFQGALPDEAWLNGDLLLLERCDGMVMVPGWQESSGARAEHAHALTLGIPVFYTMAELRRVLGQGDTYGRTERHEGAEGQPAPRPAPDHAGTSQADGTQRGLSEVPLP